MQKKLSIFKKASIVLFAAGISCSSVSANQLDVNLERVSEVRETLQERFEQRIKMSKIVRKLGIRKHVFTDPVLLVEILNQDMHLGDLESVQALFGKKLSRPALVGGMVQRIISSIPKKHPAIAEFLIEADARGLITYSDDNDEVIKRFINHIYALEILTRKMRQDKGFMAEITEHMIVKREGVGIPRGFMASVLALHAATGTIFEPIKMKTMDWVFSEYQKIRERGEILPSEISARQGGTSFNILEASIAGHQAGFSGNPMAGIALVVNPPETLRVVGNNDVIEYEFSQEWVSLYESWNLAFVMGNVKRLDLILPKLLIPSVIDAKNPDDYMFNRVLALWVSMNFKFLADAMQLPGKELPNASELSQLWGEINYKYAQNYVAKNNDGADLSQLSYYLGTTYEMLWAQLNPLLIASGVITEGEAADLTSMLSDIE